MESSGNSIGSDPVTPVQGQSCMEDRRKTNSYFPLVVHLRAADARLGMLNLRDSN